MLQNSRDTALYILDCVFSVGVVGSLVVFVWRGSWALLDIFLFPEETIKSCCTSLVSLLIRLFIYRKTNSTNNKSGRISGIGRKTSKLILV